MNKAIVSLLVAIAVACAGYGYVASHTAKAPTKAPTSGSVTSTDQVGDHFSENGVTTYAYQYAMNQASTTLCSFITPNATTTQNFLSAFDRTGTTTAATLVFGYGTVRSATTTQIGTSYAVVANAQYYVVGSSTPATGPIVYAPNTWVNVTEQGGVSGTFSPTGQCNLKLTQL